MKLIVNKKLLKKICCLTTLSTLSLTITGCDDKEIGTNSDISYDVIDTYNDELENGITQEIDVPNENFKLIVDYKCQLQENQKWTITDDKNINMEIKTSGVTNEKVYIDNIHTDTTICSYYSSVNGILQDSMDDRIHNSLMEGFSISDSNSYVGINHIEGQNETFIKGSVYGFSTYISGTVDEERFLESDYLEQGVYANKISSVIDLIIDKGDEKTFVSVPSEVLVSVWPYVKFNDSELNGSNDIYYKYYYLDDDNEMTYEELSKEEYSKHVKKLTKKK